MSKDLRIIATDGDCQREMAVINHQGDEIVISWVSQDIDIGHFTYHSDGYAHFKDLTGGDVTIESKIEGPPLDDFTGFCTVFNGGVLNDLSAHADNSPYELSEHYDSIIYIDNREKEDFVNEQRSSDGSYIEAVQYKIYLVEQGFNISTIINHCSEDDPDIHVHLYTHADPWVLVAYWPAPSRGAQFLPHSTSNFEFIPESDG